MHQTVDPLLTCPGVQLGDGSIVVYPSQRIITLCDKRIYPREAADLVALLWLAVRTPRDIPRKRFWNIPRSQPDSEVDVFCIESGDEHGAAYLDDVELTVDDVKRYEQLLLQAIVECMA